MKVAAVKSCAQSFSIEEIEAAIEGVVEREELVLPIEGDNLGEKLTHLLLAQRIHARMATGESFKDAFRALMAEVRGTLINE